MAGVYILKSEKINRYYIGRTNNIISRLQRHDSGYVKSTKKGVPWELKVYIECANIYEALSFELRLKKYKRRDITEKVIKDKTFPWNY